ncbi:MAG: flippase [bacterium]
MSLSKKIAHNTLIQILGKIASSIFALLTIAALTRYLKPDGFGQYTIIIAFLSFFGILIDMGIYLTTLQMISDPANDSEKIFSNAFTMRVIVSATLLATAPFTVLFFPYPQIVKQGVFSAVFAFFFISLCQILHAPFQKELKMFRAELAEICAKFIILALVLGIIYLKLNLNFVMLCIVIGHFFHFLIKYFFAKIYIKIKFAFDKDIWIKIFYNSLPIALSIFFNLIYLRGDTIVLSLFASDVQIGFYGASYRVLDVLTTLPIIFAGLMLPLFTASWAGKNIDKLKKYLQVSFDVCAAIAIPIVIGTQFIATPVMTLAAGKEYFPSGPILKILIIAIAMVFFSTTFSHFIVAINQQKSMLLGYAITAILSIIGYFILIPRFYSFGAAWITVFSEGMMAIITLAIIYKKTKITLSVEKLFKSLFAGAVMAAVLYFIRNANLFIIILAGAAVYAGALYAIGGVDREMIRKLFSGSAN